MNFIKLLTALLFAGSLLFSQTLFGQQTIILSEDFETGSLPAGWTQQTLASDGGWKFGLSSALQATGWWKIYPHSKIAATNDAVCQCNKTKDYLITPSLNLTTYSKVYLSFDIFYQGVYYVNDDANVEVSTDGGINWTVVTTVITQNSNWYTKYVDLSAYAGVANVLVAFRYNDGTLNLPGFAIDNVKIFQPANDDAGTDAITTYKYLTFGNYSVTGKILNTGASTLSNVTINWKVNGGPVNTNNVSVNIAPLATANFTHPVQLNISSAIFYYLEVWTSLPNGNTDLNTSNDSSMVTLSGLNSAPVKNVVLEDFTGVHCGYCVDGILIVDTLIPTHPKMIPVAIHSYTPPDAMQTAEGDSVTQQYITSFPTALIDMYRFSTESHYWVTRSSWGTEVNARQNMNVPVAVTSLINYNSSTRNLTADVTASFVGPDSADFRINVFLLEDSVTGSGNLWDQHNYYSSQSIAAGGPTHPYYNLPYIIPNFQHMHVLRKMLGGAWGTSGVIPPVVSAGQSFTAQYNYTLPSTWKEQHVRVVALVQKYDSYYLENRDILNSVESSSIITSVANESVDENQFFIYPNPVTKNAIVTLKLKQSEKVVFTVSDALGEIVYSADYGEMPAGEKNMSIDVSAWAPGVYLARCTAGNNVYAEKISLIR